jgi:hypothetical protein
VLGRSELTPGGAAAARRRVDAGSLQDQPHRAGRKLVPSLASSPWIRRYPQVGFSEASRSTKWRSSGAVQQPPVQRHRYWVQRRVTRSRCHRNTVAGVTIRCMRPAGAAIGSAPRILLDPPTTVAVAAPGDVIRRLHGVAPGSPHSSIVSSGPADRARPQAAGRSDSAVVTPCRRSCLRTAVQ